ncbi:hypothetical protein [Peribacillus simplex]|uniref:hypothetical protein n=1 Tax=Peribacillus simplex TaxID=1478 RepID=UPI0011A005BB|nr:hypothetical protein [Peribacillus simplex]
MDINSLSKQPGIEGRDINAIRYEVVSREFKESQGKRVLILITPYPFLIIGSIVEVVSDYVSIKAEVTNVTELDDEQFRVHIDDIEVFYIEKEGRPIPDIRTNQDD